MALPSNDKIIGDLGHTADHNAIVDEITFIKENYLSASAGTLDDFLRKDSASAIYLRKDTASSSYLPISASSNYLFIGTASATYLRQDTASATYAKISSPTFTGTPLAPTAASSTNNTQIATTAFVRTQVSALVDAAPSTLDTLNELAAALGDDPNFATTVTNSLSSKLDSSTASAIYLKQDTASANYLRRDTASTTYLPISASSNYLFVGTASATYLRQDTASANYLRRDTASTTYLRIDTASTTYLPISASSSLAPTGYLTSSAAAIIYAPLISPNFSGTPTAPKPEFGANNNEIATTAFVADAILSVQTGSAVDLSAYLRADTASALYLSSNDIIDGGAP